MTKNNKSTVSTNYWTHNTAYHPWLLRHVRATDQVLDVGCGDGLLEKRLAPHCQEVLGIDPDKDTIVLAQQLYNDNPHIRFQQNDFETFSSTPGSFDVIIFVASIHHTDHATSLKKAARLLRPGGRLLIVGYAKRSGRHDLFDLMRRLPAHLGSHIHGERTAIVAPVKDSELTYKDIKSLAKQLLPNAHIHRGLYYRYLLRWEKP